MSKNKLIYILTGVIVVLLLINLLRGKPQPEIIPFDDSKLLKQIELADSSALYWQRIALSWEQIATDAERHSDSLENLKPIIQHHYHEIYKSIPDGTVIQLDSIIRTNW